MAKFKKIEALEDGWSDWEFPQMQGYKMACCDCGLVHDMDFRVVKTKKLQDGSYEAEEIADDSFRVLIRAKRNNRSTAQIRRHERGDEKLDTFGQVRDLMKRLHDGRVSTSYAAHAVWKILSSNIDDRRERSELS